MAFFVCGCQENVVRAWLGVDQLGVFLVAERAVAEGPLEEVGVLALIDGKHRVATQNKDVGYSEQRENRIGQVVQASWQQGVAVQERRAAVRLSSNARHTERPDGRFRAPNVGVAVDSDLQIANAIIDHHVEIREVVGPLRGVDELHALQLDHARLRLLAHLLDKDGFLGVEPTALVNQGVGVQRGQARELAHDPANTHTVSLLHLITKVVDGAEHVDAVGGVNQGETKALGVIVPAVDDAAQFARRVNAVEHPLAVGATHHVDVVHGVGQIRRKDVHHHGLDAQHGSSRKDGQRQFDVFLKLGVFLVDGHEVERLAVQQARLKREVQRKHRGVIRARLGIASGDGNLHLHVLEGIADEHFDRDRAAFRHVQFRSRKTHHHRSQAAARCGVLAEEIKCVLWVDVPLGLAFVPVGGALADVGFSDQRVFCHGAFTHRPWAKRVFPDHAHHVDDLAILPQHNRIVAVEPRHRAQGLALVDDGRGRLGVAQHRHATRHEHPLQVQTLDGGLRAVVVDLHHIRGKVHVKRRGVVDFQGLVVARPLHVLADDQIVAQPGRAALQDGHRQGV